MRIRCIINSNNDHFSNKKYVIIYNRCIVLTNVVVSESTTWVFSHGTAIHYPIMVNLWFYDENGLFKGLLYVKQDTHTPPPAPRYNALYQKDTSYVNFKRLNTLSCNKDV